MADLWLDDSEQVSADDQLLGEAVVVGGLEGDAEEPHDAGVAGQVQGDAVLAQEPLQLGGGLGHHLEGHGSAWRSAREAVRGLYSVDLCLVFYGRGRCYFWEQLVGFSNRFCCLFTDSCYELCCVREQLLV